MQINVTGHQIDLTTSLQDYVHEKLQRLERHYDQAEAHSIIRSTVRIAGSGFSYAEAADMYATIDQLSAKLDRQVIKHKEKTVDHNHGSRERKHAHTKFE